VCGLPVFRQTIELEERPLGFPVDAQAPFAIGFDIFVAHRVVAGREDERHTSERRLLGQHERIEVVEHARVLHPEAFALRAGRRRLEQRRECVERGGHLRALGGRLRGNQPEGAAARLHRDRPEDLALPGMADARIGRGDKALGVAGFERRGGRAALRRERHEGDEEQQAEDEPTHQDTLARPVCRVNGRGRIILSARPRPPRKRGIP
jgi:hypothetical protein